VTPGSSLRATPISRLPCLAGPTRFRRGFDAPPWLERRPALDRSEKQYKEGTQTADFGFHIKPNPWVNE
jgi:hypothetical protein